MFGTKAKNLLLQFIKYGIVGVINTALTWLVIFVMMGVFGISYTVANPVGYAVGVINSFILNKLWTFGSKGALGKETALFIAVLLAAYLLQYAFTVFLVETAGMNAYLAQVISAAVYTSAGFIGNRFITFKKRK